MGGDFNVDVLGNQCNHMLDIFTRLNLKNVVQEPTRITDTTSTCIDLFITNRPNLISNINISSNFCSDHCPVRVDIDMKTYKHRCYKG